MKYLSLLIVWFTIISCKNEIELIVPETPPGIVNDVPLVYEEKLDIAYGKSLSQNYDLYLPNTRNERNPVIILLHPGAWRIGDKTFVNSIVKSLISKRVNCAIVNMNYRLTSTAGVTYVEQLEDINTLLLKIKREAKTLKISTNFFIVGLSAGGHLAMLYGNSPLGNKLAKGVAGIVPPINLSSKTMREGNIGTDITKLIGKTYAEAPNEYIKASPIFQYNLASPPTIVFFGGKDETVPVEQANLCKQVLSSSRAKSEFNFYAEQPHEWNNWNEPIDKIIKFAEKNL
ncbi:alpha/beta hydrolase [Arcicella sp. LKC2W]|uniref:alpha/beta hydrolase n=1 Tax=Arcicella sp. LKC2W TaxID=2984198 RepID=UPI002B1F0E61|nr:alpha/beta hydrolase [Arcicella sp. LKC2W]MEA5457482.1 alpha/beta hydrolase [Arcicella sp. LKC2W]